LKDKVNVLQTTLENHKTDHRQLLKERDS